MEDVLDLYAQAYDARHPTVCFDESPYQLVSETRVPLPASRGHCRRYDYVYQREGTCNLFMFFEPHRAWRHVQVTPHRTKADFARCMQALVDTFYPDAEQIRVVLDNLNTHTPAALYETFEPAEARRILRKLEFHFTPKHGSWLNMVELEFAALTKQCLDRRLTSAHLVQSEAWLWEADRNRLAVHVHWRFTTDLARLKLHRLYSS